MTGFIRYIVAVLAVSLASPFMRAADGFVLQPLSDAKLRSDLSFTKATASVHSSGSALSSTGSNSLVVQLTEEISQAASVFNEMPMEAKSEVFVGICDSLISGRAWSVPKPMLPLLDARPGTRDDYLAEYIIWIPFVLEQVLREMQLEPGSWLDDAKNGMLTLLERLGEPVVKGEDPKTGCDTLLGIILMARGVAGLPDDLFLSGLLGRPSDLPHVKLNPFLSNETSLNFKVWSDLEKDLDLGSETTFSLLCPPSHGPKLLGVYDLIIILSKDGKSIARRGFHVTLDAEVQLKPAFIPNGTMPYTHNFLLSAVPPDTFIEDLDGWIVAGGQDIDAFYGPASGARWTPQKWKLLVESMPQPNAEL